MKVSFYCICYKNVIARPSITTEHVQKPHCTRDDSQCLFFLFLGGWGGGGVAESFDHGKGKNNLWDQKSTSAHTSAKFLWSEVRRLVDNSFKVRKIIIKIRWEVRTSADWSCCAKAENSSGLDKPLSWQISILKEQSKDDGNLNIHIYMHTYIHIYIIHTSTTSYNATKLFAHIAPAQQRGRRKYQ